MDIVDLCIRERANTKCMFSRLTNLTVFAALLKDVPMGCKDSVLPENLKKSILKNERQIEPVDIKKANQFGSFKFGDVQLIDIMKFFDGATSLDSFLKAYKTEETKSFFPYVWFDNPEQLNTKELPSYDSFFSKLRNINLL